MISVALLLMVALSICAFIGLDVAMRPDHYLQGRDRRVLQPLSQHLLPQLRKASAYRLIGLAMAVIAFGSALLIFAYEFSYYSKR